MNIIEKLESEASDKKIPDFQPGDTIVVEVKVKEGDRERTQAYEGIVIARRNRGFNSSFTVRKISHGEGVERVFQTFSPSIGAITVTIEDPKVFTKPWTIAMPLYRHVNPDARLQQFKCVEFVEELMYGHLRKTPLQ